MALDPTLLIAGDFIVLRMALVDDLDGNYDAAVLLQRIAWRCERTGEYTATRERLVAETRLTDWRVRQGLKLLTERGYLTYRRTAPYDPTPVWSVVMAPPVRGGGILPHATEAPAVTVPEVSSVTSSQDPETKDETKTPPTADAVAGDVAASFARFWLLAPRKVGKGAALKAYTKAARTEGGTGRVDDAWAAHCAVWASWPADRRSFIPHPATWLGQRRWEDELPEPYRASAAEQDRRAGGDHWDQPGAGW